jgi:hypothetical protein
VATYLFGSAATGDFEAGLSDVDTVAVLAGDPTPNDLEALAKLPSELLGQSPEWDDRVETVYLSATALASFRDGRRRAARVSPGEPFHAIEVDRRWVLDWYRVREVGVALHGPPPRKRIPKIPHSEFVAAVRGELLIWPRQISPGISAGSLAYTVLTICRSVSDWSLPGASAGCPDLLLSRRPGEGIIQFERINDSTAHGLSRE